MKIIIIKPGKYSELMITDKNLSKVEFHPLNITTEELQRLILFDEDGVQHPAKDIAVYIESTFPRISKKRGSTLAYASMMRDSGFIAGFCSAWDLYGRIVPGMEWREWYGINSYFTEEVNTVSPITFKSEFQVEDDYDRLITKDTNHNQKVINLMAIYLKHTDELISPKKDFNVYNTNLVK